MNLIRERAEARTFAETREGIMLHLIALSSSLLLPSPARPAAAATTIRAHPLMTLDPGTALVALETPQAIIATTAGMAGVVVATRQRSAVLKEEAEAAAALEEQADEEMSIGELLREYGVIALLFHFSVWCTTIAGTFAALSLVSPSDLLSGIPMLPADLLATDQPAGGLGRAAVVLALVEVTGPARLALTVAATPSISTKAREIPLVRDVEERLLAAGSAAVRGVRGLLPGQDV